MQSGRLEWFEKFIKTSSWSAPHVAVFAPKKLAAIPKPNYLQGHKMFHKTQPNYLKRKKYMFQPSLLRGEGALNFPGKGGGVRVHPAWNIRGLNHRGDQKNRWFGATLKVWWPLLMAPWSLSWRLRLPTLAPWQKSAGVAAWKNGRGWKMYIFPLLNMGIFAASYGSLSEDNQFEIKIGMFTPSPRFSI